MHRKHKTYRLPSGFPHSQFVSCWSRIGLLSQNVVLVLICCCSGSSCCCGVVFYVLRSTEFACYVVNTERATHSRGVFTVRTVSIKGESKRFRSLDSPRAAADRVNLNKSWKHKVFKVIRQFQLRESRSVNAHEVPEHGLLYWPECKVSAEERKRPAEARATIYTR